jgi:hypothetical protein
VVITMRSRVLARPAAGRWWDLPGRFAGYPSVKRCYYQWIAMGVPGEMRAVPARKADLEWLMIDSTIVRENSTRKCL